MYNTSPLPQDFSQPPKKSWYQRPVIAIPVGIVAFLLVVGVIGAVAGTNGQGNDNAAGSQTAAPVTVERTVTKAAAPRSTAAARPTRPASSASSKAPVQDTTDSWTMPNEVGHNLQDAQNNIQSLTDDNIFFTDSTDATGADRSQILDANWKVCSQNIEAGSRITADSDIVFDAVKLSESCP